MLSRLLDPDDGRPRDPVFWLALAAIAAVQLLALVALCTEQVRNAQDRRAEVTVAQQVAPIGCLDPTSANCAAFHGPGQVAHR